MDFDVERASDSSALPKNQQTAKPQPSNSKEANPDGYAKFASFLCEPRYQNFRSFKYLRMRMLLRQQRILGQLESQLRFLDEYDSKWHSSWTMNLDKDGNEQREVLLGRVGIELQIFDEMLQRNKWTLMAAKPYAERIEEIRTEAGYGLDSDQVDYLDEPDLVHTGGDGKFDKLHPLSDSIVHRLFQFREQIRKIRWGNDWDQQNYMRDAISSKIARGIAASLSILVLLLPMIILNFVETSGWRLAIVSIFAAIFISTLTVLTATGTLEIFVAGATYCAVLVVFVSQGGASGS
ncbi:hypothetical protein IWZ00DRAFT_497805 [Phyllosticta capitalensis]